MKNPVRIINISSDVCCVNLRFGQSVQIRTPYSIKINKNSPLLDLANKDGFFEIIQNNNKLANWGFSNLHLGNIEISSKQKTSNMCVNLQVKSPFLTSVNPSVLKINSNQILEIVLSSDSSDEFKYELDGVETLGYGIYDNELLSDLFHIDKFQHHIWLKFSKVFYNILFVNKSKSHNCLIKVKRNNQKDFYYTKKIKLIRKP